jgi:pyruvate dehydrogenase (quinone)
MNGQRRLLGSFNHGSMANALPQAIGAQASHPGRQVVSLSGDAGWRCCWATCSASASLKLPVKVVVFRNEALAFVELEMKAAGILEFTTDLENPSFAKIAEAAGRPGSHRRESRSGPPDADAGPGPRRRRFGRGSGASPGALASPDHHLGSGEGLQPLALRAVMSGRGDELVDLAKVNLFRSE